MATQSDRDIRAQQAVVAVLQSAVNRTGPPPAPLVYDLTRAFINKGLEDALRDSADRPDTMIRVAQASAKCLHTKADGRSWKTDFVQALLGQLRPSVVGLLQKYMPLYGPPAPDLLADLLRIIKEDLLSASPDVGFATIEEHAQAYCTDGFQIVLNPHGRLEHQWDEALLQEVRQYLFTAVEKYADVQGTPPSALIDKLIGIVKSELSSLGRAKLIGKTREGRKTFERLEDIVIAYGCGNWLQDSAAGYEPYQQPWGTAVVEVTRRVSFWCDTTSNWLLHTYQLGGFTLAAYKDEASGIANLIATDLVIGTCRCWESSNDDEKRGTDRNQLLRHQRCLREHHILSFNPTNVALRDFLGQAVKGSKPKGSTSGNKSFAPGALEQGMIFKHLQHYFDIQFGNVLFWVCPHNAKHRPESLECRECRNQQTPTLAFNERACKRDAKPRLVIERPAGLYELQVFYRCQNKECGNYYTAGHTLCPLCGEGRTGNAKPSNIWTLGEAYITLHIDDPEQAPPHLKESILERILIQEALKMLLPLERESWIARHLDGKSIRALADEYELPEAEIQKILDSAREKIDSWNNPGGLPM
jgi:hypothetical protein